MTGTVRTVLGSVIAISLTTAISLLTAGLRVWLQVVIVGVCAIVCLVAIWLIAKRGRDDVAAETSPLRVVTDAKTKGSVSVEDVTSHGSAKGASIVDGVKADGDISVKRVDISTSPKRVEDGHAKRTGDDD